MSLRTGSRGPMSVFTRADGTIGALRHDRLTMSGPDQEE